MVNTFVSSFLGGLLSRHPSILFGAAGVCCGIYLEQSYVLPRLNDEALKLMRMEEEMRKGSSTRKEK